MTKVWNVFKAIEICDILNFMKLGHQFHMDVLHRAIFRKLFDRNLFTGRISNRISIILKLFHYSRAGVVLSQWSKRDEEMTRVGRNRFTCWNAMISLFLEALKWKGKAPASICLCGMSQISLSLSDNFRFSYWKFGKSRFYWWDFSMRCQMISCSPSL